MIFPKINLAALKGRDYLIGAVLGVLVLVTGWMLFYKYHNQLAATHVAIQPTRIPAANKPSPFTSPAAETAKPAEKPEAKSLPPSKVVASKPKANPPTAADRQKLQVEQLKKSNEEIRNELLRLLISQGIKVHVVKETPTEAESTAMPKEERPMSDREREEAYKDAVRKGQVP